MTNSSFIFHPKNSLFNCSALLGYPRRNEDEGSDRIMKWNSHYWLHKGMGWRVRQNNEMEFNSQFHSLLTENSPFIKIFRWNLIRIFIASLRPCISVSTTVRREYRTTVQPPLQHLSASHSRLTVRHLLASSVVSSFSHFFTRNHADSR